MNWKGNMVGVGPSIRVLRLKVVKRSDTGRLDTWTVHQNSNVAIG